MFPSTTHDAVLAPDRMFREVEPVDDRALREELRLGRVDVLRLERVVVVEAACLEAQHTAARVGEREDEAPLEVVSPATAGEPGGLELLGRVALLACLAGERRPAQGEPEPELAADLLAQPAAGEVVAGEAPGGGIPQVALVEARRVVEQREQPLAPRASRVLARGALLVLDRDPEPVGEPLHRPDEVEALGVLDEPDHVAALVTAVAVVELVDGVDREARGLLLVERAAAGEARAGLAERRALLDDGDEVGALAHRLDGRVLDARHQRAAAYSRA